MVRGGSSAGTTRARGVPAVTVLAGLVALVACSSGTGSGPGSSPTASVLPGGASVLPGGASVLPGGGDTARSATSVPRTPTRLEVPPATTTARTTASPALGSSRTGSRKPGKVREVTKACPYISNRAEQLAEGKKVGRSTVVSTSPVGCRFYLAYPDYHAVAQISVARYPSALLAFNTVARTGGSTAESTPGIGDGAVLYRTHFYRPDGDRDWACIFATGNTVVTVHTDAAMSSVDARNVAAAIVGKF